MKQEQNPVNNIWLIDLLNFPATTKPKKNDPIIEIKKLLIIKILNKVPKNAAINKNKKIFLFTSEKFLLENIPYKTI